jgi:hypothetical protein
MDNLSGYDVVKTLRAENPGMSIEDILDKSREILFKKNMEIVNSQGHKNVFCLLRALIETGMSRDDIIKGITDTNLLESGHFEDAFEFINSLNETREEVPVRCFPCRTAAKGKPPGTFRQLSK